MTSFLYPVYVFIMALLVVGLFMGIDRYLMPKKRRLGNVIMAVAIGLILSALYILPLSA